MTDQDWINLNFIQCLEETLMVLEEIYPSNDARIARLRMFLGSASEHYNKLVPPETQEPLSGEWLE